MTFRKRLETEVPLSAAVSCKSPDQSLHTSRHSDETAGLALQRHGFITTLYDTAPELRMQDTCCAIIAEACLLVALRKRYPP